MKFELVHFETIRHHGGMGSDRNYGIILKWRGWDEVIIEIDFLDTTKPDDITDVDRNHYLAYNKNAGGEVIKGSDIKFTSKAAIKTNDLYFQTYINDFDSVPSPDYFAEYTKTYVIRIKNAQALGEFVEFKIIKYANRTTAPANQGDIMVPPKP